MSFSRLAFAAAAMSAALIAAGCDDPLALPPAIDGNFIDTVAVFALTGTPISAASGYDVVNRRPARTDRSGEPFDFAVDVDEAGEAQILTPRALGLGSGAAIQTSDRAFAEILVAPLDDYEQDTTLTVQIDDIFIVRSRATTTNCVFFLGQLPRYGKFRVLAVDLPERRITLEALVNINCGYRGLEPGLPTN